jgi:alpha-N-arabinofuranosidase
VSEWNAQSTDWRTGLYAGGLLNGFERLGDVLEIGAPALFLRHVSATEWDNAFINFDHTSWFPAPNYVVMKLWRDHYAPARVALEGDAGPLNIVATRDGTELILKTVNPTGDAVTVNVETAADLADASMLVVAPGATDARNTLSDPKTVAAEAAPVGVREGGITFRMPPLSAGVVELQLQAHQG